VEQKVDQSALRVNQAFIVALTGLGIVLGQVWLVGLVGLVLVLGTVSPPLAAFQAIYRNSLRPAGIVRPDVIRDDPAQHRFAQAVGATFLIAATVALSFGFTTLGWVLAGIVVALAAINLAFGFCAGCFMYYQLGRLGLTAGGKTSVGEGRA
jgi:uncharacterized membrane protein YccF (DUF307 family)